MPRLLRKPITWMVAAEICVLAALGVVSWQLMAARSGGDLPALFLPAASPPNDTAAPVPADALSPPSPSSAPLLPGLNVDPAFWQHRLVGLNEAQAQFEALEWRLVSSALDSMQRYIESVVIPSIRRAESG